MDTFTVIADDNIELVRDMAGTHADFLRLLPVATEGRSFTSAGTEIRIALAPGKAVSIHLGKEDFRRIGPTVALPTTTVRYGFHGMPADEIEKFLASFDRYYQRGGG